MPDFTGFDFIFHVNIARTIIAYHNDSQRGGRLHFFHSLLHLLCELGSESFDIENHRLTERIYQKRYESNTEQIEDEYQDKWREIYHTNTSWENFSREFVERPCDAIEWSDNDMDAEECEPAEEYIDDDSPVDQTKKKSKTSEEVESDAYHD